MHKFHWLTFGDVGLNWSDLKNRPVKQNLKELILHAEFEPFTCPGCKND